MREPCFDNLLKVLKREKPERPTLFEFYLNTPLYEKLAGFTLEEGKTMHSDPKLLINAFKKAGYDYATIIGSDFQFPKGEHTSGKTQSLNEGVMIIDRESFEKYPWPDPDKFDYSRLDECSEILPDGMKMIVWGFGGVLENVIALTGYDNLCMMLVDDPELVTDIFQAVGSRFVRYYEICATFDSVGALISNDDWGFNTQTMLSPKDMREYVFPWHKKIVDVIHKAGKLAILHSCGNLDAVFDDIVDDMKYDAKHSYEDNIIPVEEAYERWSSRIAILGGIDMDYVCRSKPEEISARCKAMLERTTARGGYALGTGNSIPEYVPDENYFAMINSATGGDNE
jgi:uroporphyrinogen decarboxylase